MLDLLKTARTGVSHLLGVPRSPRFPGATPLVPLAPASHRFRCADSRTRTRSGRAPRATRGRAKSQKRLSLAGKPRLFARVSGTFLGPLRGPAVWVRRYGLPRRRQPQKSRPDFLARTALDSFGIWRFGRCDLRSLGGTLAPWCRCNASLILAICRASPGAPTPCEHVAVTTIAKNVGSLPQGAFLFSLRTTSAPDSWAFAGTMVPTAQPVTQPGGRRVY